MITLCPVCCRPLKKGEAMVARTTGGAYVWRTAESDGDTLGEHRACFDRVQQPTSLFDTYRPES